MLYIYIHIHTHTHTYIYIYIYIYHSRRHFFYIFNFSSFIALSFYINQGFFFHSVVSLYDRDKFRNKDTGLMSLILFSMIAKLTKFENSLVFSSEHMLHSIQ